MPHVFLSYRRQDTLAMTGRIHDRLSGRFGHENVFMDLDDIPYGIDFREHLEHSLEHCDVLLAVIGPHWLGHRSDTGAPQLADPADFVRLEIETALRRGIPVIPVLVGDTPMPRADQLPPELQPLLYRQAASVDMGRDFHVHMERLMGGIEQIGPPRRAADASQARRRAARGEPGAGPDRTAANDEREKPLRPASEALREVLRVDAGSRRRGIGMWALVGSVSGLISWLALSEWDLFGSGILNGSLPFIPVIAFGAALYLVGEYAGVPSLGKRSKVVNYAVATAGSVLGSVGNLLGYALLDISRDDPVALISFTISGALGSLLVVLPLLWGWRLGRRKGRYVYVLAATGAVAGLLGRLLAQVDTGGASPWYWGTSWDMFSLVVPWQALVLAAIATAPILTRDGPGGAERPAAVAPEQHSGVKPA